jgi:DNA-binding CsgD family transcriptional regulator
MGVGLHGENGIDPETTISLLRTYVLPILYYGLEILLPTGKILEQLNIHYKKVLKQLLSLYINVADPAIYILSGLLPIEAEIHIKVLTFFGNKDLFHFLHAVLLSFIFASQGLRLGSPFSPPLADLEYILKFACNATILEQLNIHYKKVLKQILSLYINVADPAIYILSGLLPIEAEIHAISIMDVFYLCYS